MTWGTILQRSLGYPLINLGFSGNGRLEKEVLDFICEIDARLYILDCLPNLTPKSKDEITQLVSDAVKQIRATHSSPILLVEHAGYSNALADDTKLQDYVRMNEGAKKGIRGIAGTRDKRYLLPYTRRAGTAPGCLGRLRPSFRLGHGNTSERRRAESTGDITHPQRRPLYHNACHPAPGTQ